MFLLPMPNESVQRLSLGGHLALVGTQQMEGNRHLLNELTRILYFTFCLVDASGDALDPEVFLQAEEVLDRAVLRAEKTGIWRVEREEAVAIEPILRRYDDLIASVSSQRYLDADVRLTKLLQGTHTVSPLRRRYGKKQPTEDER